MQWRAAKAAVRYLPGAIESGADVAGANARQGSYRYGRGREMARDAARVETFSDGVFGVVLTVMAVELLQTGPARVGGRELPEALADAWPSYLAYVITFGIAGQVWIAHHNIWRYVVRVDQMLLVLNLLVLLFIATIPFTADLLSDNLRGSATEQRLTAEHRAEEASAT
ncbi:Protein of unknown function [Micromonospora chokoriensis]|uniref:DUF1211 domain-containing protein n=1 Tax=Micromonospora chokoriensis TaxID=356851 RepID=A0A1C4ZBB7_9ACTN|nr:Protein of unknown function [Micromonospora chokoriensis]